MKKSSQLGKKLLLSTLLISGLIPFTAYAQVPAAQTTVADPGRIQKDLRAIDEAPKLSESIKVKNLVLQNAPEGAENMVFQLSSLDLDGVTVYDRPVLGALYNDKIGQNISLADVYAIAEELTRFYRNNGYILTQVVVPPQTIDGGNVKLNVVEGFINQITVEGPDEQETALDLVREYANGIDTSGALNIKDLERHLLLINDLPGLSARSVLSPSNTVTGAANLRILVERTSYDAYVSLDNYGSRYLGPYQASAFGSLNSFFGNNERITAQFVAAPDPGTDAFASLELGYYALGYSQPLPILGTGTTIDLYASHTDTEPGFDLRTFEVEGTSQYASVQINHPFIRTRSTNLLGRFLVDWRNVESKTNLPTKIEDNLRAVRVGANYQFLDTIFGVGVNSIDLEFARGLEILGSSNKGDTDLSRTNGNPEFTTLNGEVQRLQRVTNGVNLLLATKGQWSAGPLLSSEEFGAGGTEYGRGYDSSEIVGDDGVAAKAELQWNNPYETDIFNEYQLFAFYDFGRTWNQDATTSAGKKEIITSTGAGIRAEFLNEVNTDLFFAVPLTREVQTQGDEGSRVFFSVSKEF